MVGQVPAVEHLHPCHGVIVRLILRAIIRSGMDAAVGKCKGDGTCGSFEKVREKKSTRNVKYLRVCPVHYDVAAPHLYSASSQTPVISSFNQLVTNVV